MMSCITARVWSGQQRATRTASHTHTQSIENNYRQIELFALWYYLFTSTIVYHPLATELRGTSTIIITICVEAAAYLTVVSL